MRILWAGLISLGMCTAAYAGGMSASFDWGPTKKCFDGKSPPFKLSGVPDGTVKLDIRMVDLNAPGFSHGGGKVAYSGQKTLAYGAFRYKGPCPPTGRHKYRFTVKALDAKGKKIGEATATKSFP
ncbi:phospholipid-binding protein [Shinella sp. CPCC 101442]|uniref:YbhB/YbcL family Raf kinase inhibitor-like protein n=1 Tax=Shinella sp. CPCC 101442 TaxID=2932265 RepID=UPI002153724E|nr:YbhB/YbcL family Raf kinase inhibitor-like protein [Shinella sp. CPCC 101442]MCR6498666.1 phospholipid-binding protein [Shinella sp. CPCC 101442]